MVALNGLLFYRRKNGKKKKKEDSWQSPTVSQLGSLLVGKDLPLRQHLT